jgi:hypothetical protein
VDTLIWDATSTCDFDNKANLPKIFYGITSETLKRIAEILYTWIDDREVYMEAKKEANKEAKKALKELYKMQKKLMKENKKAEENNSAENNNN